MLAAGPTCVDAKGMGKSEDNQNQEEEQKEKDLVHQQMPADSPCDRRLVNHKL